MVDHEQTEPVLANVSLKTFNFTDSTGFLVFLGIASISAALTLCGVIYMCWIHCRSGWQKASGFGGVQSYFKEFVNFGDKTLFLQIFETKTTLLGNAATSNSATH